MHSRVRRWLVFLDNFVIYYKEMTQSEKTSCQKALKIWRAIIRITPEESSATEILSALTVQRLVVERGRFQTRE